MIDSILGWLTTDRHLEWISAILGFLYIFCSIKEHLLTWFFGILTSALYVYVFFVNKFYADMSLQVYYVVISFYGWYMWMRKVDDKNPAVQVRLANKKEWVGISISSLILYFVIWYVLKYHTDSPVPVVDAFTTACSIVATWMMTRKILEQWIFWVVIDFVSMVIYLYKGMVPTSLLMGTYTVLAVVGFVTWKKQMKPTKIASNA
ncbi:nicotinamide riboside transporter PnuC [Halosquirtibacter laminarini]|uniref:Nicotinamide riboside transporter PnuC n=1 Tax=Halosquirtibacter laminarini TaxID=3374600 RepID=A0AC61NCK9_9BACT|nr:nicotinamide riboside transporter PnuC [Prolixibacteraceae bacterium]